MFSAFSLFLLLSMFSNIVTWHCKAAALPSCLQAEQLARFDIV